MEWKVTASIAGDGLLISLGSRQQVSVDEGTEMDFWVRPFKVGDARLYEKWKLGLALYDGRNCLAQEEILYDTLAEATTDAEALVAYLQITSADPESAQETEGIPTVIPTVRITP